MFNSTLLTDLADSALSHLTSTLPEFLLFSFCCLIPTIKCKRAVIHLDRPENK